MECVVDYLDFIEKTNNAETINELSGCLEWNLKQLGYDHVIYCLLSDHISIGQSASFAVVSTYPEEWLQYYIEQGYLEVDPVVTMASISSTPFNWSDIHKVISLNGKEKRVLAEGKAAGLLNGVGVPIHGPKGELAGLGISSANGVTASDNTLSLLHSMGQQFHQSYIKLATQEPLPKVEQHDMVLTKRQREVLSWVSEGKTNWEIAKILSITEHGVDYHLRNIFKKLEVNSRITAVSKAFQLGLVQG